MFLLKLIVIRIMVTLLIGNLARAAYTDTCNTTSSKSSCCKPDMQKDGINSCGYVISIRQVVNYPGVNITINSIEREDPQTTNFIKKIEKNFLKYMSKEIRTNVNSLVVKKIKMVPNREKYNLTYDIYINENTLSPSDIAEDFVRVKAFYRRVRGRKHMFEGWHKPKPEQSDICTQKALAFQGQNYNFINNVMAGTRARSKEQCADGRSKASVECKTRKYVDGSSMAYYDYETLSINSCELQKVIAQNGSQFFDTIHEKPNTLSEWEILLLRLAESANNISADSDDRAPRNPYGSHKELLSELAKFLKQNKSLTMSTLAFNSVLTIVHSLSEDQNMQKSNDSSSDIDIAFAIEIISTRIELQQNKILVVDNPSMFVMAKLINSSEMFPTRDSFNRSIKTAIFSYEKVDVFLPKDSIYEIAASHGLDVIPTSFIAYKNNFLFRHLEEETHRISPVLSVNVADIKVENLSVPMSYQVASESGKNQTDKKQVQLYKCVYLDENSKDWRTDGCSLNLDFNVPTCECNHLTNFAVLVKTNDLTDPYALEIFGKVGCSISIISLVLMLLCQFCLPKLRKIETNKIHTHLGVCLLIAYVIFLAGVERVIHREGCISIAACLQFFLLSSWGWMTIECVTMYKKLVLVFGKIGEHYVLKCAIFVYLISATIVAVNVVITVGWLDDAQGRSDAEWLPVQSGRGSPWKSFYVSDRMCWLHDYSLVFGFLCPIGICLLINVGGFALISKAITCDRVKNKAGKVKTKREELKTYLVRASIITFMLGLTWAFAIPLVLTDDRLTNVIFGWLFSVANSLQGFFIFFLLYVKRKDVRNMWMKKLRCSICFHVVKESAKTNEGASGSQESPTRTRTIAEEYSTNRV